jgi:DNA polymerase-4
VAVGGRADKRGVIAAASYEARKYGVHSAMPTAQALRLCPALVLVPADFDKYTSASQAIMAIFQRYTPLVEPLSLDEAFLDVAGCERLFGDAEVIGRALKADILRETRLVASIGIAPSKFLAKLASGLEKPDGFKVIQPEEVRATLDPLPVSAIFGVGERTAKRLEALGVTTVSQLASRPREEVMREFGASGAWIHDLAHGIDPRRVNPKREEKSHGLERTFEHDISEREELKLLLYEFCEEVSHELRHRGLRGRTVTLKARYADFRTLTRSKTVELPINLGKRIYAVARELLDKVPPGPLRLLGVQLSGLSDVRAPVQASLFGGAEVASEADDPKLERAAVALDKLRARYGAGTVVPGSLLSRASLRVRAREGEAAR